MSIFFRILPTGVSARALLLTSTLLAVILLGPGSVRDLRAQQQSGPSPASQNAGNEAADLQQIALTDKQVQGLLDAQKDLDAITGKLPEDKAPDAKVMAQLDAIAKKHGFASYVEYGNVAANVDMLLDGFDPQTKKFVGFEAVLKSQIAHIDADSKIPAADKKEALEELNAALKNVPTLQYPANVDLVTKYYDKLNDSLRGQE